MPFPSTLAPIGAVAIPGVPLPPPPPLLADDIDPVTGDFRSIEVGVDPIDAQVQLAVSTVRASGVSVLEDGLEITADKMDESVLRVLESDVRIALGRLIANGDIRLDSVEFVQVDEGNATVQLHANYTNLRAADRGRRTVPVSLATPVQREAA